MIYLDSAIVYGASENGHATLREFPHLSCDNSIIMVMLISPIFSHVGLHWELSTYCKKKRHRKDSTSLKAFYFQYSKCPMHSHSFILKIAIRTNSNIFRIYFEFPMKTSGKRASDCGIVLETQLLNQRYFVAARKCSTNKQQWTKEVGETY